MFLVLHFNQTWDRTGLSVCFKPKITEWGEREREREREREKKKKRGP